MTKMPIKATTKNTKKGDIITMVYRYGGKSGVVTKVTKETISAIIQCDYGEAVTVFDKNGERYMDSWDYEYLIKA